MPTIPVINPATGQRVREFAADTRATLEEKHRAALAGARAWRKVPLARRLAAIRRFRDAVERHLEALATILTTEMGKPITQSRNELKSFLGRIDYFLAETPALLRPDEVHADRADRLHERITREPLGVVANISAWNYPYFVGGNVFVPALLTGNAVLYKPSEFALGTGIAVSKLLHESGVPKNVFIPVIGSGAIGDALVGLPVDGIFFTGSNATGRRIAAKAGHRMIRLQLELGGKDPAYVCEDADIATAAASLADGAFYNTGQSCCSVERIYAHRAIHARFLRAFVDVVKGFPIGNPADDGCYIGPLARPAQIAVLREQVRDALKKGARLLAGGDRLPRPGNYFEPTVLGDVTHDMKVMREESFGPIIGIMRVRDDAHAVRMMNDSEFGLTAAVYTPDRTRAEAILDRVEAGSAYWNCCDRVSPRLPWTGVKQSGTGVTLSHYGIDTFTRLKAWHLKGSKRAQC